MNRSRHARSTTTDDVSARTSSALIYLRVSTREQAQAGGEAEGYSIPAQREACRRRADSLAAEVDFEFVDAGESARSADRPQLKQLLAYVAEHKVDYLIVHKVDRLARNRADDVMINLELQKHGVTLVSCSENIDETPSGLLLHGIMATIAEFYSRNLGAEALKGMEQKAQRGGTIAKAPIGYLNVGKMVDGREARTVELDVVRAPIVAGAFEAYATGDWTLHGLLEELTRQGLRTVATPKRTEQPLALSRLHSLLRNRYYIGKIVFNGVEHDGVHPPLVTVETFNRVAAILESHRSGEKDRKHPHYLRGSVFCGGCGSRLCVTKTTNRHGKQYEYFFCLGRHQRRTDCQFTSVAIGKVEALVEKEWSELTLDPTYGAMVQELVANDFAKLEKTNERTEKRVVRQLQAQREQRKKLLEAYYAGALPIDLLKSEQLEQTRAIEALELQLVQSRLKLANLETVLRRTLEFLYSPAATYAAAPAKLRRQLNQAVFERFDFEAGPKVDGVIAEPFATVASGDLVESVPRSTREPAHDGAGSRPLLVGQASGSKDEHLVTQPGDLSNIRSYRLKEGALAAPTGFEPVSPP